MKNNDVLYAVMTPTEAEDLYGLGSGTVLKAVREGKIPSRKSGRIYLILRADVEQQWSPEIARLATLVREWRNMDSLRDISEVTGIDIATFSRAESSRLSLDEIQAVAGMLGIS